MKLIGKNATLLVAIPELYYAPVTAANPVPYTHIHQIATIMAQIIPPVPVPVPLSMGLSALVPGTASSPLVRGAKNDLSSENTRRSVRPLYVPHILGSARPVVLAM